MEKRVAWAQFCSVSFFVQWPCMVRPGTCELARIHDAGPFCGTESYAYYATTWSGCQASALLGNALVMAQRESWIVPKRRLARSAQGIAARSDMGIMAY